MMFKLFNRRQSNTKPQPTAKPCPLPENRISASERHRLADTVGARRRMEQMIEDNRLR
jgi:hypothetical protein